MSSLIYLGGVILQCYEGYGEATAGSLFKLEGLTGPDGLLRDDVGLGIRLIVGVGGVGIDGAGVLADRKSVV